MPKAMRTTLSPCSMQSFPQKNEASWTPFQGDIIREMSVAERILWSRSPRMEHRCWPHKRSSSDFRQAAEPTSLVIGPFSCYWYNTSRNLVEFTISGMYISLSEQHQDTTTETALDIKALVVPHPFEPSVKQV